MDNLFVERLWQTVKYEEVYLKAYADGREARRELGAYFNFYNTERLHQSHRYRTPAQVFGISQNGAPTTPQERTASIDRESEHHGSSVGLSHNLVSLLS